MEISVTKQQDTQTIAVKASGIINSKEAEKMALRAGTAIIVSGFKKCFFDLTETVLDPDQTMSGMFMFVEVMKKAGLNASIKMASLLLEKDEYRDYLEKSAISSGLHLKHFTDREEALSWLRS
jgi:hypothetical protein